MKTYNSITLRGFRALLPKRLWDYPPYLFTAGIIPITYVFEVWIALPAVYEPYSFMHLFLFVVGHFILYNIVGNMLGILLVDTSIRKRIMPSSDASNVNFCPVCEAITPPRSYHCPECDICILKRDHHCKFTGCCIGHYNYRFFLLFLVYLLLGVLIALPINISFLWESLMTADIYIIPKLIFPLVMLVLGPSVNIQQCHIAIAVISVVGMMAVGAWFYFHANLVLSGRTVHEMRRCINLYDLGRVRNIEQVLGKNWHLAWLSPSVSSPLPSDGIEFETNPSHHLCTNCTDKQD